MIERGDEKEGKPHDPQDTTEGTIPDLVPEKQATELIGCWAWSNGAEIKVMPNWQAHNGIMVGPWKSIGKRRYDIDWPDFIAKISVAKKWA